MMQKYNRFKAAMKNQLYTHLESDSPLTEIIFPLADALEIKHREKAKKIADSYLNHLKKHSDAIPEGFTPESLLLKNFNYYFGNDPMWKLIAVDYMN